MGSTARIIFALGAVALSPLPAAAAEGGTCLHDAVPPAERAAVMRSIQRGGRSLPASLTQAVQQCRGTNHWTDETALAATMLLLKQLSMDDAYRRTLAAGATAAQLETIRQRLAAAHFEVTLEGLQGDGDGTPLFDAIRAAGLQLDGRTTAPLLEWLVWVHDVREEAETFAALP